MRQYKIEILKAKHGTAAASILFFLSESRFKGCCSKVPLSCLPFLFGSRGNWGKGVYWSRSHTAHETWDPHIAGVDRSGSWFVWHLMPAKLRGGNISYARKRTTPQHQKQSESRRFIPEEELVAVAFTSEGTALVEAFPLVWGSRFVFSAGFTAFAAAFSLATLAGRLSCESLLELELELEESPSESSTTTSSTGAGPGRTFSVAAVSPFKTLSRTAETSCLDGFSDMSLISWLFGRYGYTKGESQKGNKTKSLQSFAQSFKVDVNGQSMVFHKLILKQGSASAANLPCHFHSWDTTWCKASVWVCFPVPKRRLILWWVCTVLPFLLIRVNPGSALG